MKKILKDEKNLKIKTTKLKNSKHPKPNVISNSHESPFKHIKVYDDPYNLK